MVGAQVLSHSMVALSHCMAEAEELECCLS